MQKGIIGKKLGMTQLFDANGKVVPVTVIEAGPCTVVQKKTEESDGYQAVQLGFGEISAKKVNKAAKGHFDKADVAPQAHPCASSAWRISSRRERPADILKADVFHRGRPAWTWSASARARATRASSSASAQHRAAREPTATGPVARHCRFPTVPLPPRPVVFKGKRLPGHMGAVRVTVQNLIVVKVDAENNLIAIKGAIPGAKGSVVTIHDSVKA